MHMHLVTLLASAMTLLLAIPLHAATISGMVKDAGTKRPLPFATVSLHGVTPEGDSLLTNVLGDQQGAYRIADVAPGTYEIRAAFVTYTSSSDRIQVEENDLSFDPLLAASGIALETVIVEGQRLGREELVQPGLISLNVEQLESLPAIGEPDPIRGLQLLPGVQAASDISSGLYIRGGGPDQTLVLLDDITVYNPTHAFGFFSTFNTDALSDVALYKGAYPAEHAGRLGAVVDVTSRTPDTERLRGKASISTTSARLTLEGPAAGNQWLLSGRRTYLEPILSQLRKSNPSVPYYNFYDLNARFVTRMDGSWTELTAYHGRDALRFEPDKDTNVSVKWGNSLFGATYNRVLSSNVIGKLSGSISHYQSTIDSKVFNTPIAVNNRLLDVTGRALLDWKSDHHLYSLGLIVSAYDFQFDQSFNLDAPIGFRSKPLEYSMFLEDQWDPRAGTSLRLGMRTRYITDGQRLLFEPRASFSQSVRSDMRIKVAGGVYNQYLQLITTEGFSAADLYVPVDDSASPSHSVQGVVGWEWEHSRAYQLTLEGYYTDMTHLLTPDNKAVNDNESFKAADLFLTGGTGYATGVEAFLQKRTGPITGWLGYTLGWSRRRFAGLNGGETYAPKYDRRHDFSAVMNYRTGPWSTSSAFVYATGQAFTPASARFRVEDPALGSLTDGALILPASRNSARLLPYHRIDFSVTRDFTMFGRSAQWYLQIYNLYSRRNEWFVQFDDQEPKVEVAKQLPIIPSLGLQFSF